MTMTMTTTTTTPAGALALALEIELAAADEAALEGGTAVDYRDDVARRLGYARRDAEADRDDDDDDAAETATKTEWQVVTRDNLIGWTDQGCWGAENARGTADEVRECCAMLGEIYPDVDWGIAPIDDLGTVYTEGECVTPAR